jgi:hypothetical protein
VNWADHLRCPTAYSFLIVISAISQHLSSGYLFFPLKWLINYPNQRRSNASGGACYLEKSAGAGAPVERGRRRPERPTRRGPGRPAWGRLGAEWDGQGRGGWEQSFSRPCPSRRPRWRTPGRPTFPGAVPGWCWRLCRRPRGNRDRGPCRPPRQRTAPGPGTSSPHRR